jgi:signal transduction histidine kinase/ActR/RegA family two-component response regulator
MADEYAYNAPARRLKQALSAMMITQNLRYWLVAVWAIALGFSVGWQAGALWGAAAAAASVLRGEFEHRLARGAYTRPELTMTAMATANGVLWVIAPLLAWNTGRAWPQMIAVSMVLAASLMVFTQFGHRLRQAAIANAPYVAAAAWFALQMQKTGEFWPFIICILVMGAALATNVLFSRVHRMLIERYQSKRAVLIGELEAARDVANAANAAKSTFLAMISHELRTPMNGVLGAAQLLDGASLSPAQKRYVEMIRTSGDSLLNLLNDMLDFAKIESGKIEIESIEIDLPALCGQVGSIWSAKAESKGLGYALAVAPDAPTMIVGDPTRLSQIIHNLLSNATKFTAAGRVSLTVDAEWLGPDRARISLAVADTGLGISAEDRARLFQPFSQLDSSSTRRFGGTGLGLAISQRLAGLLGGSLDVASQPGEGSTFTLTLDVAVAAWIRPDSAPAAKEEASAATRPLKIMVAEDHPINRKLLLLWLEMEGHSFTAAENGQIALEHCASQVFDVILMDVNMPVMDGLSAVRALRRGSGANRDTPVVMLSASARAEDHDAGLGAGADAYLSKPIDFAALRFTLEQVANRPKAGDCSAVA